MYGNEWTRSRPVELGMQLQRVPRTLAVLVACLLVFLVGKDAFAKPYAAEMPSVADVRAKVQGPSPIDTEVRQHAMFSNLAYMLDFLLSNTMNNGVVAPEDRALAKSYRDAQEAAKTRGQALLAKSGPKGQTFDQLAHTNAPRARADLDANFPNVGRLYSARFAENREATRKPPSAQPTAGATGLPIYTIGILGVAALFVLGCVALVLVFLFRSTQHYGIDANNPRELRAGAKYHLYSFTGQVVEGSRTVTNTTHGTQDVNTGYVTNQYTVTNVIHDLTLLARNGAVESFTVSNAGLALLKGHVVSVVWPIKTGKDTGATIVVRNHSTNRINYVPGAMKDLCYPSGWPILLSLLGSIPLSMGSCVAVPIFGATHQDAFLMLALAFPFATLLVPAGLAIRRKVLGDRRIKSVERDLAQWLVPKLDEFASQGPT